MGKSGGAAERLMGKDTNHTAALPHGKYSIKIKSSAMQVSVLRGSQLYCSLAIALFDQLPVLRGMDYHPTSVSWIDC